MISIETIEELEALYGQPAPTAIAKEVDRITPHYAAGMRRHLQYKKTVREL